MWKHFILISYSIYLCVASESKVKITKCKWDDSKCIKNSAQEFMPTFVAGIPEIGVVPTDPIHFKKIDASSPNLKLILKDIDLTGLKDCKIKKIERDIVKSKLSVKLLCDADLNGQYEINGKLILFPIEGQGKLFVKIRKIQIKVEANMGEIIGKDGETYWDVKSWKSSFELKDKCEVDFENLFNGDDEINRTAREFITNNANEIILDIGQPIVNTAVDAIVKNVKRVFRVTAAKDLALN